MGDEVFFLGLDRNDWNVWARPIILHSIYHEPWLLCALKNLLDRDTFSFSAGFGQFRTVLHAQDADTSCFIFGFRKLFSRCLCHNIAVLLVSVEG